MFESKVTRFGILAKKGFKVMKTNFYEDIEVGFELLRSLLVEDKTRFVENFCAVDLTLPEDQANNYAFMTRYNRQNRGL